ncbi:MAG: glycoside hydrolase family 38 C-terminal domain-containing protein [Actinomycetota bacterium]|nr:glycoside hydrolase family 38 C-terminal domain-containing protein [Actinomycetota bacterium]
MHDDSVLVERRIRRELGERVLPAMYRASVPMTVTAWDAPGEPVPYAEAMAAMASGARPFAVGDKWSRPWGTTWFRFTGQVPPEWLGTSIEAVIDLGFHPDSAGFQSEGLVWAPGADGRGEPVQGIHPRRTAVPLNVTAAGPLELVVEAAANPAFPMVGRQMGHLGSLSTAGDQPIYTLRQASLAVRDDEVFHLLLDVEVLLGVMAALPATSKRRQRLLRELEAAFDVLDLHDVHSTAAAARKVLAPALAQPAVASAHQVVAVGHAHIDTAWLWPLRETVRKCARTFASATQMMDLYPEYRFVCSQAAQYDWIERLYPPLFERIRERVARGQWQPVGGMWVEADMNLPSGESLVRQMVHGQRYFESRFGVRCNEVWIPDVFGYPASLPQIFRAGGCERFVTQKLSWNKQNRFPHSTFQWQGLDGSQVLTHFPPVDTYNATIVGEELVHSEQNFKEHGWSDVSLMPFGHGNGGGGPTREMIERARRVADLDGAPRVRQGTTDEFFAQVEAEIAGGAPAPVWSGELYFEMHRGTLTSQAATKVGNRRCEGLLREAELWWAAAGPVPAEVTAELETLWKDVLLQQFHDIIPGSSITWVYEDAEAAHTRVAARLQELIAQALARVTPPTPSLANAASTGERREVVATATAPAGDGLVQLLHDGTHAFLAYVPALGTAPIVAQPLDDVVTVTEHSFANGHLAVNWDLDGTITSIMDVRAARELLPVGKKLSLELAPDHPIEYDAWDVEEWTLSLGAEVGGVQSVAIIDDGPLVATLRVLREFGRSTVQQDITLRAGSPRLDISFDIDWFEDEKLLSLMVPLDVHARDAACDIQFGHVMRPTHASTSWDAAKFEVCAHRYVDVSEPGFGVAVLNDGRYGHGVQDGGIRVSLLRAAKFPSPVQDHGSHQVRLAILPHGPGLHDVLREAEALNAPLREVLPGEADVAAPPVVRLDHPGVQVSAVKRADDGSGDLIVRLYEACGARTSCTVAMRTRISEAASCNLLEEPQHAFEVGDGIVALTLRPFELVTLRLK